MNIRELVSLIGVAKKVIVKFESKDSSHCKSLSAVMNSVMQNINQDVKMFHVDVDSSPELIAHFGIKSVPFVLKYEDGKLVDNFVGVRDDNYITEFIEADGKYAPNVTSNKRFF